jgi:hypothetical protein
LLRTRVPYERNGALQRAGIYSVIAVFVTALGFGAARAQTSTDEAPVSTTTAVVPDMPLWEFASTRRGHRQRADRIKLNRCRGHVRRFLVRADQIAPDNRFRNLGRWSRTVRYARTLSNRCFAVRMWNWFNTSGAACVKSHEGAWTSATGNGYWGGFQADMSFQAAYGGEYLSRWGTANNWAPVYQIHMAYRGWLARGWYPWPTTSRMCGLL